MTATAAAITQIRKLNPSWLKWLREIELYEQQFQAMDHEQLRRESRSLQYRARSGEQLDSLLAEAYALVRETANRCIGMRHYEVQLIGGIAMYQGCIAVMQTGEGKTLTATLPLYLHALLGKGSHLATANDYLAQRDAELMRPIFDTLGMTVGVVQSSVQRPKRQAAYESDVTYTTAKEIGFDFLRDRLLMRRLNENGLATGFQLQSSEASGGANSMVQRELHAILVDEADSILIDEARTPLIVSSNPDDHCQAQAELYRWSAAMANRFVVDEDYTRDEVKRHVTLTRAGRRLARKLPKPEAIGEFGLLDIYDHLELAILVSVFYQKDRHYVIRDEEVVIVDEFTGRLAEGRKWRSGLHQSIEAREHLEISFETGEAARITIQDLMLKYRYVAGMTGTAANSGGELKKIYSTKVAVIPTNRPPRRRQLPDSIHGSDHDRWTAIVAEVEELRAQNRPVLIGTRSIDKSEYLSKLLSERAIEHEVLNARHLEREAEIVSAAGGIRKVTVATNMAGRGTDIQLHMESLDHGGLHVICSELHESARIDRQLIGRCGRQGDPGSYRQFMSLEDDILANGLGERTAKNLLRYKNQSPDQLARFAPLFRKAQSRIEHKNFKSRKLLLYYERQRQKLQREMGQDPYLDSPG